MRCHDARVLLSTRRDLNRSQRSDLEAHLASCRACAAEALAEDRVSRLLARLPDPGAAPPARVAAAIGARAARRGAAARASRGLTLVGSLGAVAAIALVLLNAVSGGALLPRLEGPIATGAQPAAPPPLAATPPPLAYLVRKLDHGAHTLEVDGETGQARPLLDISPEAYVLDALDPASGAVRFSLPIGDPPNMVVSSAEGPDVAVPTVDLALSPDGARLYYLDYRTSPTYLVAADARSGAEVWRQPLFDINAWAHIGDSSNLSLSPDGVRLFLRATSSEQPPAGVPTSPAIHTFDAATGAPSGGPAQLPPWTDDILPLGQGSALVLGNGLGGRIDLASGAIIPFDEAVSVAGLLPGGERAFALTPDLKALELDLSGGGLRVVAETDLVRGGAFFFERAAVAADGRTVAVARNVFDAEPGDERSIVEIYRTDTWQLISQQRSETLYINSVSLSADGATLYLSTIELSQPPVAPDGTRPASPPSRLISIDIASGAVVADQLLPPAVGPLVVGP